MTRTQRIVAQIVFWIYIAAVLYLCFGKFGHIRGVPRRIWGVPTDKFVHFCMFLPFTVLAYFAFKPGKTDRLWKSLLFCTVTFLVGVLIAAGTEYGQTFLPYRSGDRRDLQADVMALAAGTFIVLVIVSVTHLRKKRKHA